MGLALKTLRLRFGMRGLLIVVTILAVLFAVLGVRVQRAFERQQLVERIIAAGGQVSYSLEAADPFAGPPELSWFERLLGVDLTSSIPYLILSTAASTDDLVDDIADVLPEIEWLDLYATQVSDAGLEHLTRLPKLSLLRITHGSNTNRALTIVGRCQNLQQIELSSLPVAFDTLEPLVSLRKLSSLKFYNVDISDRSLAVLPQLQLESLSILGNHSCTDEGLVAVGRIHTLKTLKLEGVQFTGAGLRHLSQLVRLRVLDLSKARIGDAELSLLAGFPQLGALALSHSELDGTGFRALSGLKKLTQVILWDVPVTDVGLEEISRLKTLKKLAILGALVTDEGLAYLPKLANLETLDIRLKEGAFTQHGASAIAGMTSLRYTLLEPMQATATDENARTLEMPREP